MSDIPDDMRAASERHDRIWPLRPELTDKPWRVEVWPRWQDAEAASAVNLMRYDLASRGVPVEEFFGDLKFRAWFDARDNAKRATESPLEGVMRSIDGPDSYSDGRLHKTIVVEYLLPDGRRHLHVRDDFGCQVDDKGNIDNDGVRYVWHGGNWSCDCNRAIDLRNDEVEIPEHVGGDCRPDGMDRPWVGLGRILVRTRNRVTGDVVFELIEAPEDES